MTDLAERAVARLTEIDDAIVALEHERSEISTALRVLSTFLETNSSTAARKDVPFEAMHDASPDSAAAGGKTSAEAAAKLGAGTQAPPVETIQEPVAVDPADPLRSGASEGNEDGLPAPEAHAPDAPAVTEGDRARSSSVPRPAEPGTLRIEADLAEHPAPDAGEGGATTPSPGRPSNRYRVSTLFAEHPEYTRKQAREALGMTEGSLDGTSSVLGIKWAPEPKPETPKPPRPVNDDEIVPRQSSRPAKKAEKAIRSAIRQEHRKATGEYIETANKRSDVSALHAAEPWLTPEEASARLNIPIGNLRIFTQELDLAWGQGERPALQPTQSSKKIDRIRLVHSQHPTWTARMIANHLGEKESTVSTLLAIVRREVQA